MAPRTPSRTARPQHVGERPPAVAKHPSSSASSAVKGIAEVSHLYGVSPRALRFYESKGLLTPQRVGRTRLYGKDELARLTRIMRAKQLGMPLDQIKHYLDMYGQQGEGRLQQLEFVLRSTQASIEKLMSQREQIDATLLELKKIQSVTRQTLARKRKAATG